MPDLGALDNIDLSDFPPYERALMEEYLRRKKLKEKGEGFLSFVKHVMPEFIIEEVHVLIARHLEKLRDGEIDRLMVLMPPRTGKSLTTSELLPAWWEGHFPGDKLLHASYASTLVEKFGRKIRNMIMSEEYHEVFPDTVVAKDSRASAQWGTTAKGEYNAVGVGGGVAGKGGNLLLVDDPVSEQDMFSSSAHNHCYEWYGSGYYTRRQPDRNAILVTMTRWRTDDLVGRLLADAISVSGADQWTVLKIPAIIDQETADLLNSCSDDPHIETPHHYREGDSFSPRRWPLKELLRSKANMSARAWAALYMQSPVLEEGGLLQAQWWKLWPDSKPLPEMTYILQSYDVAAETDIHNDNTARTTWGVFKRPSDGLMCAMIMEYTLHKKDFPDLLENALAAFEAHKPDRAIIEKASSGIPLYQEFRKRGIRVTPIKPIGSKYSRADAASIPLSQGVVYYPNRAWARKLIEICAQFPSGPEDDSVDSTTQALNFIRRMFLLETPGDEEPEDDEMDKPPVRSYARRQSRMRIAA